MREPGLAIICALNVFLAFGMARQETQVACSPDGKNVIRIYGEPLSYEVLRDGKQVIARSRIGLGGAGGFEVELLARNDGVAYRFVTKSEGETVILNETAEVRFAPAVAYVLHKTEEIGCEENIANVYRDFGAVALATNEVAYLPLLAQGGDFVCAVTDAGVRDYPIWNLKKSCDGFCSVFARYPAKVLSVNWLPDAESDGRRLRKYRVLMEEPYLVKTQGPRVFPWRVFALADKPSDLIGSTIVDDLAGDRASGDFSWVRPGKVAWDWWNAFDNKGDPGGCTTATYGRFIDFAASNGVEYVILDEGWSERLNIWKFHPNVDVPHLIEYAAKRNVGIVLWMAWAQIKDDEEHVAEHFANLGAKGFKVDFMDSGDAMQERFLWKFAEACAKNRMIVDYHGVHRPTGLSKAYPNVLNWEGVHGLEQMKAYRGEDILANDVAIVFTRMLAGPMDYTPGAMDNYQSGGYPVAPAECDVLNLPTWKNPGSLGTRARQMAMMVVYSAPLQMLCDSPTKYERERECFDFMRRIPTVWTRTVGLGGTPQTYVALARQVKQTEWYVAGLTNGEPREIDLNFSFLAQGRWSTEIFCDEKAPDALPRQFVRTVRTVEACDRMSMHLAAGGGFVMRVFR